MLDAYSEMSSPSKNDIIKEILNIMVEKYPHKDIDFLSTIVNYDVNKYDEEKNLAEISLTGYMMFHRNELIKIVNNSIQLTEEN